MEGELSQSVGTGNSDDSSSSSSLSSSGSQTLSEGDVKTSSGGSSTDCDCEGQHMAEERAAQRSGGKGLDTGHREEEEEELDNILSPPPMQSRKCSNPEVSFRMGKSGKYKKQLSEDGRLLRRGSLGGALTGRYLLPAVTAQQTWQASSEKSNLVRMRSQTLGQSAPSLTASLLRFSWSPSAKGSNLCAQPVPHLDKWGEDVLVGLIVALLFCDEEARILQTDLWRKVFLHLFLWESVWIVRPGYVQKARPFFEKHSWGAWLIEPVQRRCVP
ncbi:microtubule-associated serine/threonine-protein kinase 4-like [Spea bombifrons]|uniref:microtubule-associated serine/threonine-protein kinase 4-like n=1 Tax=Spea bombifrons TaxID=233779 RepID=UPI00234B6392|nr:microtubule-associated serine/threonine-protein kinase 4-like [Spea bombifrons]